MLKERFFKTLKASRAGGREWARAEPIDLGNDGDALLFDALMAALSLPGLVPSVPLKLPLGTRNGGEVHRFSSSLLASGGAVADAVSAGAEQILIVAACTPGRATLGEIHSRGLPKPRPETLLRSSLPKPPTPPTYPSFSFAPTNSD